MTRENKLALIIGFSLILVVAILISDHLSPAQSDRVARLDDSAADGSAPSSLMLRATLPSGKENAANGVSTRGNGSTPSNQSSRNGLVRGRDTTHYREPARVIPLQPGRQAAQTEERSAIEMGAPSGAGRAADNHSENSRENGVALRTHIVRKGDTLYRIAQKYYGDPAMARKLAEFNRGRIMSGMNIRIGVTLNIPDRAVLTNSAKTNNSPTPKAHANSQKSTQYTTYKIKSGDTLSEISLRLLGTSKRWHEIVNLNKNIINDSDNIPLGKTIRIPHRR